MPVIRNGNNPQSIQFAKSLLDVVLGKIHNRDIVKVPNDLLIHCERSGQ